VRTRKSLPNFFPEILTIFYPIFLEGSAFFKRIRRLYTSDLSIPFSFEDNYIRSSGLTIAIMTSPASSCGATTFSIQRELEDRGIGRDPSLIDSLIRSHAEQRKSWSEDKFNQRVVESLDRSIDPAAVERFEEIWGRFFCRSIEPRSPPPLDRLNEKKCRQTVAIYLFEMIYGVILILVQNFFWSVK
jgi:hypothetical protein